MNTKVLLKIAATSGAFVLVGGISVAALARSGAGSTTAPRLPVVSTPEVESDATETPEHEDDQGETDNDSEDDDSDD
jgi:hypothetical protein